MQLTEPPKNFCTVQFDPKLVGDGAGNAKRNPPGHCVSVSAALASTSEREKQ